MPFIAVNDRVLVTIAGRLCGQRTLNTFLYRISAVTANLEYIDAMQSLRDALNLGAGLVAKFKACCPENWFASSLWTQVISPTRRRKLTEQITGAGTSTGVALTANLQASITRVGVEANRQNVGGIRIPIGGGDDVIDEGQIQAPLKAALDDLAAVMEETIITVGSVATYIPQVGLSDPPSESVDLFSTIVQDTVRVIRRRTVGLGI